MDDVMKVATCAAAGAGFGFGPESCHIACTVPFVVASGQGRVSLVCAGLYASFAALPALWATFDYTASVSMALLAWSVPSVIVGAGLGAALATPRAWRAVAVIGVLVGISVPPLAGLTLISPLSVAGLLFPGLGLWGLSLFVALLAAVSVCRPLSLLTLSIGYLIASVALAAAEPAVSAKDGDTPRMAGVDTWRGQADAKTSALLGGAWRLEELMIAEALDTQSVVWPEGVYQEWTPLTGAMLALAERRMIGGTRTYVDESSYVNTLIDGATGEVLYAQRSPVPLSFGEHHQAVDGQDLIDEDAAIAALLCIEIANPWRALTTFATAITPVIWAANLGWSTHAALATRMQYTAHQWSRLFGIPVVTAVNHPEGA